MAKGALFWRCLGCGELTPAREEDYDTGLHVERHANCHSEQCRGAARSFTLVDEDGQVVNSRGGE